MIQEVSLIECLICLESFNNKTNIINLSCCNALYHKTCLSQWIFKKLSCPHCRHFLLPKNVLDYMLRYNVQITQENAENIQTFLHEQYLFWMNDGYCHAVCRNGNPCVNRSKNGFSFCGVHKKYL